MAESCDKLVLAKTIITQNETREIIDNGAVAVKNGLVLETGPAADLAARYRGEVLDMGRSLVMPGLVNAHTHCAMTILRGLSDDLPLMQWLSEHIFPVEQGLTREIVRLGARLGCAEMAARGVTAFSDMYLIEDGVGDAVEESGLRAELGEVIFAFPSPAYADLEAALDVVRAQAERYRGHERITVAVMPHAVYTTTPELLAACFALAEELDLRLNIHLAESAAETAQSIDLFGKRPVAYMDSLGLLSGRTALDHCVEVDEAEIERLAETGCTVAHCPESNQKLASGLAPTAAIAEAGVPVGIGTDGAASNNALNMFSAMKFAALTQKVRNLDPTVFDAQQVLDMGTLGGAACLGRPKLGRIAPGAPADLIGLDLTAPNLAPLYNPVSQAVYAACGAEVNLTMVGGDILYRDGAFTRIDYPALLAEIDHIRQWVLARAGA